MQQEDMGREEGRRMNYEGRRMEGLVLGFLNRLWTLIYANRGKGLDWISEDKWR
jgi:hypothetical protein